MKCFGLSDTVIYYASTVESITLTPRIHVLFQLLVLSEGKIPFHNPIMKTMDLHFTDEDNDPALSREEWTVILTFDYLPQEARPEALTSKRARRTLATV